jgi:hypothetical protein
MYTHEKVTLAKVAETIAELMGCEFDGEYDPARHASGNNYFIPDDTLMQDEALHLGIRSATALYGGVVPHPFAKTKVITHDLVSPTAIYSVFSTDDARIAGKHLLPRGAIRLKDPLGDGGYGQTVIAALDELDAFLENFSTQKLGRSGLALETNLSPLVTRSVGHITICGETIAYYGMQRTVTNNKGQSVYGGSQLVCVRGGWDALERLAMDPAVHFAVVQARLYDRAAGSYPGFYASRRNYDVGQGLDGQGRWRSGVFEASWRSGGASTAEIAAFVAFARDPTLQVVEASALKEFGKRVEAPLDAIVHFHGNDLENGPILRYTVVRLGFDRTADWMHPGVSGQLSKKHVWGSKNLIKGELQNGVRGTLFIAKGYVCASPTNGGV